MAYLGKKRVQTIREVMRERGDERINVTVDYLIRLGLEAHRRGEKPSA